MSPEPRATYRVQLHKDFGFQAATAIVPYLAKLGISHLYCSPYLQARTGSTHGYDVVDQRKISDELGGEGAHRLMCDVLREHGMSHILDVVPNHMTITDRANAWWWDVLKHGPESHYASYFDIDWDPPEAKLHRTILVPILGDHYGKVLRSGEIKLELDGEQEVVRYFEHVLPVAPGTTAGLTLAKVNGDAEVLHQVLERQHYRLAFWRSAGEELNYRRFFSINDLAALRMDNPDVFDRVHELVLTMVRDGRLEGLRIDHIDGLRDPEGYLTQLRSWAPEAYIVVEKILEPEENLRSTWPVEGTTGYDFLNEVYGLFVDPAAEGPMTATYERFIDESVDLNELKRDKKLLLMRTELAADIERLTELFAEICQSHRDLRDYTRNEIRDALRETIAAFPVYRTYVSTATGRATEQDVEYVDRAVGAARDRRQELSGLLSFLAEILLLRVDGEAEAELAMRLQQTTGPVMAKGVEDTVFYVYNRFVGLNEVGADPAKFGISLDEFHEVMARAQKEWPRRMLATSTHDTKRSEDVRARLSLLSQIPERWDETVTRWSAMNDSARTNGFPDPNMEYLLYQTLVGAWPLDPDRAVAYAAKAAKEAKVHTSWIDANAAYDEALERFVRTILSNDAFTKSLAAFVEPLVEPGRVTALAQALVKLTAPGVPDVYQGTELWDLSLVDPDNRRPVDYAARDELIQRVAAAGPEQAMSTSTEGGTKLFVIQRALRVRREFAAAFGPGSSYDIMPAAGAKSDHVVAYSRGHEVAVVVPRLMLGIAEGWADTRVRLPQGRWRDVFTDDAHDDEVEITSLLSRFPVALLTRDPN